MAAALLALVVCCATPPAAVGYMQEIGGNTGVAEDAGEGGVAYAPDGADAAAGGGVGVGADSGGGGAPAAPAPVDLQAMADNLPDQIVPGMDTMDVLKLLSGKSVVDDRPGTPWSAKRPKDTGDFNVKHDHDGDGHMCDPATALSNLQTLKDAENGVTKKGKKGKGGGGGGGPVDPDAHAARLGFEQCLNDIMPGLLKATDFSKQIPCHTKVGVPLPSHHMGEGEGEGWGVRCLSVTHTSQLEHSLKTHCLIEHNTTQTRFCGPLSLQNFPTRKSWLHFKRHLLKRKRARAFSSRGDLADSSSRLQRRSWPP